MRTNKGNSYGFDKQLMYSSASKLCMFKCEVINKPKSFTRVIILHYQQNIYITIDNSYYIIINIYIYIYNN